MEQHCGVVVGTLDRPDKLNALSPEMRIGLRKLNNLVHGRDDAKALVITGAGRGLCSGADLAAGAGPAHIG